MRDESTAPLEVWGGIECTINRVGDTYHDQLARSGHHDRIRADLSDIAHLGIRRLRYPVLWEHTANAGFADADEAMGALRGSTTDPIVGLLHHGSGPPSTDLADEAFPDRFASYAHDVASRYPWVQDFTPINEPLTTARFAGLYGHWYPHGRDDVTFVRILLNQVRAIILAMRAIRGGTPGARLIQTEDLGRADGTGPLAEQVGFENARRWLTFDLLFGRVDERHALYRYLVEGGADPAELAWIAGHACPPDVIGLNHYPRSNRWLDHRLALFDARSHGGNGRTQYADVAACDTRLSVEPSLASILGEVGRRYRTPIAVTELHVPGDDDDRIDWWRRGVEACLAARRSGGDVRAVTAWSLLGSYDWDTLCTTATESVTYEPGAYDVATGERRETPLAAVLRETAQRLTTRSALPDPPAHGGRGGECRHDGHTCADGEGVGGRPPQPRADRSDRSRPDRHLGTERALDAVARRRVGRRGDVPL